MPTGVKLGLVIAGWFISLSVMGSGMRTWAEMWTPAFVLGALGQLGVAFTALYSDKPRDPDARERMSDSPLALPPVTRFPPSPGNRGTLPRE